MQAQKNTMPKSIGLMAFVFIFFVATLHFASAAYIYSDALTPVEHSQEDIKQLQGLATKGDAKAHNTLAEAYIYGFGVPKDIQKARGYFEQAAKNGQGQDAATAANRLGIMYFHGDGVAPDSKKAFSYFEQAVRQEPDYDKALYNLADMYYFGEGVEDDDEKGLEYYEQAAKLGNVKAHYSLGITYCGSRGKPEKGLAHYEQAANQGYALAQFDLGRKYQTGRCTKKDAEKAREYYEKAIEQGRTSILYIDDTLADKRSSAHYGYTSALRNLGSMYRDGEGLPQDFAKAITYFEELIHQGNVWGYFAIGMMLANGQGYEKDVRTSLDVFSIAAARGYMNARGELVVSLLGLKDEPNNMMYAYGYLLFLQALAPSDAQLQTLQNFFAKGADLTPKQRKQAETLAAELLNGVKKVLSPKQIEDAQAAYLDFIKILRETFEKP